MNESFDAVDFALYLRQRWRVAAFCCGTALVLAGIAGAMLPRRYTATSTLVIQPPASSDSRAALAVSPVYLESLKTYENFASGNTLFSRAIDETGIRKEYPTASVEALKRRVLTVTKAPATRIIEIQATLGNPQQAERLARFIAEQTVALNESIDEGSAATGASSVDALTNELNNTQDLHYDVQHSLSQARNDLAELLSRSSGDSPRVTAARARISNLEDQEKALVEKTAEQATALERSKSVARRERLEVLDPGIVPERPSYPNIPLMMLVAFTVSLAGSAAYLAVSFGYSRAMSSRAERVYNMR